jgi:predicted polyphosphate/ATP-dependent NAD kinase
MSTITTVDIADIERLSLEGNSVEQIQQLTGRSNGSIVSILDGQHILQTRAKHKTKKALLLKARKAIIAIVGDKDKINAGDGKSFLPTPQQIQAACEAIRETWTDAERYSRHDFTPTAQEMPPYLPDPRE